MSTSAPFPRSCSPCGFTRLSVQWVSKLCRMIDRCSCEHDVSSLLLWQWLLPSKKSKWTIKLPYDWTFGGQWIDSRHELSDLQEQGRGHVRINAGNPLSLRAISQMRAAVQLCIAMFIALIVNDLVEFDRWCQVRCQLQPGWILTFVSIGRRDERVGRVGTAGWIVEQDDIPFDALEERDQEQSNAQERIHFLELLNNKPRVLCFD